MSGTEKLNPRNLPKSFWLPFLALNLLPLLALAQAVNPQQLPVATAAGQQTNAPEQSGPPAPAEPASNPDPTAPPGEQRSPANVVAGELCANPAPAGKQLNPEVTLAEMTGFCDGRGLFRNGLNAVTSPQNSVAFTEAHLEGMVFKDCLAARNREDTFQFIGFPAPGEASPGYTGPVGFRIIDKHGKGRACMRRHFNEGHVCNLDVCTPIRKVGATLSTGAIGDKELKFCFHEESEHPTCVSFAHPLIHKSFATLQAEANAREELRKRNLKAALRKIVAKCTRNPDQLDGARQAVNTLEELGEEDGVIERLRKSLDRADLELMKKEVNTVDISDLDEVKQHLKDYTDAHPEKAEDVAKMYHDLAIRKVKHRGATQADFYEADALISEAEKVPGISSKSKDILAGYHQDIGIGTLQAMTQNGITDPSAFWPSWMNTMWNIENTVNESCTASSGFGGMGGAPGMPGGAPGMPAGNSGCSVAMNRLSSLSQIPQAAQAAQAKQYAFQQQVQQQIQAQMNMYRNPAMNQLGGAAPGGMPGQGQPLGMGGFQGQQNGQFGAMNPGAMMPGVSGLGANSGFYR